MRRKPDAIIAKVIKEDGGRLEMLDVYGLRYRKMDVYGTTSLSSEVGMHLK